MYPLSFYRQHIGCYKCVAGPAGVRPVADTGCADSAQPGAGAQRLSSPESGVERPVFCGAETVKRAIIGALAFATQVSCLLMPAMR